MPVAKVEALHNRHYFESLLKIMETNDTYMVIDGSNTLWHENDIHNILDNLNLAQEG